jgi:hypothetical protein
VLVHDAMKSGLYEWSWKRRVNVITTIRIELNIYFTKNLIIILTVPLISFRTFCFFNKKSSILDATELKFVPDMQNLTADCISAAYMEFAAMAQCYSHWPCTHSLPPVHGSLLGRGKKNVTFQIPCQTSHVIGVYLYM